MINEFGCMAVYLLENFFIVGGTTSAICAFFNKESRRKNIIFSIMSLAILVGSYAVYKLDETLKYENMGWMTWGDFFLGVAFFAYTVVSISFVLSVLLNIICAVIRFKYRKKHLKLAMAGVAISVVAFVLMYVLEKFFEGGSIGYLFIEWLVFFPLL